MKTHLPWLVVLLLPLFALAKPPDLPLEDGRPFWHHVASRIDEWGEQLVGESGLSSVGAVVGATHPKLLETARALLPRSVLLLPGVGAQGGRLEDLAPAFTAGDRRHRTGRSDRHHQRHPHKPEPPFHGVSFPLDFGPIGADGPLGVRRGIYARISRRSRSFRSLNDALTAAGRPRGRSWPLGGFRSPPST